MALDQLALRRQLLATGEAPVEDRFVVDIRAVHADEDGSMRGAVQEVEKYCTKLTR
jgi:hypothetical protein